MHDYYFIKDGWFYDQHEEIRLSVRDIEVIHLGRDYGMLVVTALFTIVGALLVLSALSLFCVACAGTNPPPPKGVWKFLLGMLAVGAFLAWVGFSLNSSASKNRRLHLRLRSGHTYKVLLPRTFAHGLAAQLMAKEHS